MTIKIKNKLSQHFCKHEYWEGVISKDNIMFVNLSGDTYTMICVKCGKVKSERFVPTEREL